VASDELTAVKARHRVSATIRRSDGVRVRAVSDTRPDTAAQSVMSNLEDAYLMFVSQAAEATNTKAA
jgi:hypothetical protein